MANRACLRMTRLDRVNRALPGQLGPQKFIHLVGIGLALAGPHHLVDEEAGNLVPAGSVLLHLGGVGNGLGLQQSSRFQLPGNSRVSTVTAVIANL